MTVTWMPQGATPPDGVEMRLEHGRVFDLDVAPKGPEFDFDRVEGMLLGVAIGDSLGNTTEGMLPSRRRQRHGEIRDYLESRHASGAVGVPSDDTQLTFWTLEQLIEDGRFVPENVAECFSGRQIFGIGSSVKQFLRNRDRGDPWYHSGAKSAGNGALMRISPILLPHLRSGGSQLWKDAAACAMVTHNDRLAMSSAVGFVRLLWDLLDMKEAPSKDWWLDTYVETVRDIEGETRHKPRGGREVGYEGTGWEFTATFVAEAARQDLSVVDAGAIWYSGAYLLETIPSVIYILMKYGHDPEEALVRAVNDTKDNDTIASIVGAAIGALYGADALPERWRRGLLGRTGVDDDGAVESLIKGANQTFYSFESATSRLGDEVSA